MEKQNLQFLLAVAVVIIIYLINRPKGRTAPGTQGAVTQAVAAGVENLSLGGLKQSLGMTGGLRRMYPREDAPRETVLISLAQAKNTGCPAGFEMAPADFTLSNGGCHVTCGGNGNCGVGPEGLDSEGVPVLQRCCIAKKTN